FVTTILVLNQRHAQLQFSHGGCGDIHRFQRLGIHPLDDLWRRGVAQQLADDADVEQNHQMPTGCPARAAPKDASSLSVSLACLPMSASREPSLTLPSGATAASNIPRTSASMLW